MGLFSRKKQDKKQPKTEAPPAPPPPSLTDFSGMQVEVLTAEDALLFTARLSVSDSGSAKLWQAVEGFVPPFEPPLPVKLRGYHEAEKKAVHFEGDLSPADEGLWSVENLRLTGEENDRAFFRQDTLLTGDVRLVGWIGAEAKPCEIINLSAGGVRLRSQEEYQKGDKLLLTVALRTSAAPVTLLCEVRRASLKKNAAHEYGCRFVNLDEPRQDQIAEAIMEMQRQKLRR